ncbi:MULTISPECIES: hypothetical protein [unclassified Endozoicomonas]|uniref:hypothetical protein n=1 Tax=unclassified Endozoicomonas TaxID=2644528 RepID=UPI002147BFF1|nr:MULTISPECIES: hypothetical protein [unclassified Endozoicomonas]
MNCFIHPCYGVCQFRSSSDGREPARSQLDSLENLTSHTEAITGQSSRTDLVNRHGHSYKSHSDTMQNIYSNETSLFEMSFTLSTPPPRTSETEQTTESFQLDQTQTKMLLSSNNSVKHHGQHTCDVTVFGEDSQPRLCETVCKNARVLSDHKRRFHTAQQTCDEMVFEEDCQQRPCGKTCKNIRSLSVHKSKYHTGQATCNEILAEEDRRPRRCGTICKSAKALTEHRSMHRKRKRVQVHFSQ